MQIFRLAAALLLILAIEAASVLAAIGSIGASDNCGGCDTTPGWASVGMPAAAILLCGWLAYVVRLRVRRRTLGGRRPGPS